MEFKQTSRDIVIRSQTKKDFIVTPCEKNFDPIIIERDKYLQRELNKHLLDGKTYKQLNQSQ